MSPCQNHQGERVGDGLPQPCLSLPGVVAPGWGGRGMVREGRRCRLPSPLQWLYETWGREERCGTHTHFSLQNAVVMCTLKPHAPKYFTFTQSGRRREKNKRRRTAAGQRAWEGQHPHRLLCWVGLCSLVNVLPTRHMSHTPSPNPVTQLRQASSQPGDNISFPAVLRCRRCLGR